MYDHKNAQELQQDTFGGPHGVYLSRNNLRGNSISTPSLQLQLCGAELRQKITISQGEQYIPRCIILRLAII